MYITVYNKFTLKIEVMPSPLFTIDLKIDNQLLKLKVHAEDNLSDLIASLTTSITWKKISQEKVKNRLEEQFRKIIASKKLSEAVKNKLEQLLQESKIVIVGIQNSHNHIFDETPFKILQESTINGRKTQDRNEKHYQYLNNNYHLHNKYDQNKFAIRQSSQNYFENIVMKPKSPQKYSYCVEADREDNSDGDVIRKKYEEIDRKCQDYICRNLANSEQMKECYDRYRQSQQQRQVLNSQQIDSKVFERSKSTNMRQTRPRRQIKDTLLGQYEKRYQEDRPLFTQKNSNKDNRNASPVIDSGGESFQTYKMNRYKSMNSIHANSHSTNETNKSLASQRDLRKASGKLMRRQGVQNSFKRLGLPSVIETEVYKARAQEYDSHVPLSRDYSKSDYSCFTRQTNPRRYQYDIQG